MDLKTKALLLSIGRVQLSRPQDGGQPSTAGPGAGESSVFFQSGRRLVRLSVVDRSPLSLEVRGDEALISLQGRAISRGRMVEPLLHSPGQAYITVSERCIYDCRFCAVPRLKGGVKSHQRVVEMVKEANATGRLESISLTSGTEVSPQLEGERVAALVCDLKQFGVPIGVSVNPFPGVNRMLYDAGADEVKYNLETPDRILFSRVCPGLSYQEIMDALEEAVELFGENHVFSNLLVGLGESDQSLRQGMDELTDRGVLPILRAAYPHPLRLDEVDITRPSAERLLKLARYLRMRLDQKGLDGRLALTGCYCCTGCDLVPGRDL
ncbi:MAG: radical SAM protein [Methanothrix sp.]|uniref:radical SAM protein n=2 Tax=Methanothrix sp. TaxID=90426 RepID=UPI0025FDD352|nr:radical SAM protein [Methanothrix sp.]MBK7386430.1 radical SAM protein [Methanothrix sp.]